MNLNLDEKTLSQLYEKQILYRNEKIMGAIETASGQLICTDTRIILYIPKIFGRFETESFQLNHITYINFKQGMMIGSLILNTSGSQTKKFDQIEKKEGQMMNDIINNQINISNALASGTTIPNPNPKLELQMKFVNGVISEQEYYRRMMAL